MISLHEKRKIWLKLFRNSAPCSINDNIRNLLCDCGICYMRVNPMMIVFIETMKHQP